MITKIAILLISVSVCQISCSTGDNDVARNNYLIGGLLSPLLNQLVDTVDNNLKGLLKQVQDLVAQILQQISNAKELLPTTVQQLSGVIKKVQDTFDKLNVANVNIDVCQTEVLDIALTLLNTISATAGNCLDDLVNQVHSIADPVFEKVNKIHTKAFGVIREATQCLDNVLVCGFRLRDLVKTIPILITEISDLVTTITGGPVSLLTKLPGNVIKCFPYSEAIQTVLKVTQLLNCLQKLLPAI